MRASLFIVVAVLLAIFTAIGARPLSQPCYSYQVPVTCNKQPQCRWSFTYESCEPVELLELTLLEEDFDEASRHLDCLKAQAMGSNRACKF